MALFLTSLTFTGAGEWLRRHGVDGPVLLIDNASRNLDDRDAIVGPAQAELAAEGIASQRVDVLRHDPAAVERAGAIVMTGGDPFVLLADLRASGADATIAAARNRGVPIVGQSAGAIVCGPTLEPIRLTSPFTAPDGLDLRGLTLTDTLVLPHHDRPGRAELHRRAALRFGSDPTLFPLWDDETLVIEHDTWQIRRGAQRTRRALSSDAPGVADVFGAAARAAWGSFLPDDVLTQAGKDLDGWKDRVRLGGHRFLVVEDDDGLIGFVWYHHAASAAEDAPVGEIDVLYTHPRAWGAGTGRRLLDRATWNLLCEGYREAVLWTEERNERALGVYSRSGWVPDGAIDERKFLGAPIRNARHRLDLTRYAGGE
ncbi:MAG TPA: GNAT family N-acetyltransferase [Pseudomonadales bacterium]